MIFVSYNFNDGGSQAAIGNMPAYFGVLRVVRGDTCQQLERCVLLMCAFPRGGGFTVSIVYSSSFARFLWVMGDSH